MAHDMTDDVKLAVIQNDMQYLKEKLDRVDTKLSSSYITKEEFEPIKRIVYGMVGLILVAVVGAMVSLVLKQ
jgi:chaperonin cofactor prefoldin